VSDTMLAGEVDRCWGSGKLMSEAAARHGCSSIGRAAGRHLRSCCCRALLVLLLRLQLLAVTRLLGPTHSLWRPLTDNGTCCRCCSSIFLLCRQESDHDLG
jgi:hypothetical protein